LKQQAERAAVPEDVDWTSYAEIYDPPPAAVPELLLSNAKFEEQMPDGAVDAKTAGLLTIDLMGTGEIDLLVWSSRGVELYRRGFERVTDTGLDVVKA
jgi:hypothetical protein